MARLLCTVISRLILTSDSCWSYCKADKIRRLFANHQTTIIIKLKKMNKKSPSTHPTCAVSLRSYSRNDRTMTESCDASMGADSARRRMGEFRSNLASAHNSLSWCCLLHHAQPCVHRTQCALISPLLDMTVFHATCIHFMDRGISVARFDGASELKMIE